MDNNRVAFIADDYCKNVRTARVWVQLIFVNPLLNGGTQIDDKWPDDNIFSQNVRKVTFEAINNDYIYCIDLKYQYSK